MRAIQKDFPILNRKVNGKKIVYLDNASTSQKPKVFLHALQQFYTTHNANIHRGIHTLSTEATEQYEITRKKIASYIGAASSEEIIFTKNCTEAINCVRFSWGQQYINSGDEIIVSGLEHHANFVPWQTLAKEKGAVLKIIPVTANFQLDMDAYKKMLSKKTKLVCVTSQSNVTGTINPVQEMARMAHAVGAYIMVDGAQSVGHKPVNVKKIDCDFFAFSAHKMLGPTGVGVLHVKKTVMEQMPPFMYGGEMVESVQDTQSAYRTGPWKFEAGTPNIADIVAFGTTIDYLKQIGITQIAQHDKKILAYAKKILRKYPAVRIFSPTDSALSGNVLSFTVGTVHPHDIATIFNNEGIAIRSGLHCAEPLARRLGITGTARMSFYIYNNTTDIDKVEKALQKVIKIFKV